MGVRDILPSIRDGGPRTVHYECRDCGQNLDRDDRRCPACGGTVVVYEF
ncbi:MAG: hypothetical protein ABEJ35_01655 [Halobacteriaceae archaeon]